MCWKAGWFRNAPAVKPMPNSSKPALSLMPDPGIMWPTNLAPSVRSSICRTALVREDFPQT